MSIKYNTSEFKAIGSNGCALVRETSLMSCDGVQCSGPRGKQAKSYPLSDIISFSPPLPSSLSSLLSPVPSNPFLFIHPRHHTRTASPPSPPNTRPLKSALSATTATFPATHNPLPIWPTGLSSEPTHGVSPSPAPTPSPPHRQPFAHRSSSESPRRARPMLTLSHFFRSLWVALEFPPRAHPRFPYYTL